MRSYAKTVSRSLFDRFPAILAVVNDPLLISVVSIRYG